MAPGVSAVPIPVLADKVGDSIPGICERNRQVFLQSELAFPNYLLELINECCHLWVTNFTRENQLLKRDTHIVSFTLAEQSGIKDVHTLTRKQRKCGISE